MSRAFGKGKNKGRIRIAFTLLFLLLGSRAHNFCPGLDLGEKGAWALIRLVHHAADLTLVTSPQMKDEMEANGIPRVEVWRKGVDTEVCGKCAPFSRHIVVSF